ncbi:hypothetical protein pdam_00024058 [Pocillopora damicornis]|uniref:Uncharacterized protein n=1 Tax=Pocillopora damicornis TaxID=46731 RepID=A0A3M6UH27_POCDA|nr:hypothetical protein pdam_00024058 [Pocillopora damicornis]
MRYPDIGFSMPRVKSESERIKFLTLGGHVACLGTRYVRESNVLIKNDTFQKVEYCKPVCIEIPGGQLHRYCLVQYTFKSGQEHPIPKMPQGNSKKKKMPYVRTRDQLKIVAGEMKPKEALHHVINRWPWWSKILCGIRSGPAKSTASKRYGKA